MINKILIGLGVLLGSVLLIENIVSGYPAYVFLDTSSTTGMLTMVSMGIGALLGFGVRGFFYEKSEIKIDDDF